MKAKPGSKFKLKSISAKNTSKRYQNERENDIGGEAIDKIAATSQYETHSNDKTSVRYRKCEGSHGEFTKFVKNSPIKISRNKSEENKNCCCIV